MSGKVRIAVMTASLALATAGVLTGGMSAAHAEENTVCTIDSRGGAHWVSCEGDTSQEVAAVGECADGSIVFGEYVAIAPPKSNVEDWSIADCSDNGGLVDGWEDYQDA